MTVLLRLACLIALLFARSSEGTLYTSRVLAGTNYPHPAITRLSPSAGVAGQLITIAGAHFGAIQPLSIVTFSGIPAAIDSWTDSAIVAVVPPGVPSGPVVVTANGLASNGAHFSIVRRR